MCSCPLSLLGWDLDGEELGFVWKQDGHRRNCLWQRQGECGCRPLPPPDVRRLPSLSSSGEPACLFSIPPDLLRAFFSLLPRAKWRALLSFHVGDLEPPALPRPYLRQSLFLNIDQWVLLPQGFFPLDFSISVKKNTVQMKDMPRVFALCSYFLHKQLLCTMQDVGNSKASEIL